MDIFMSKGDDWYGKRLNKKRRTPDLYKKAPLEVPLSIGEWRAKATILQAGKLLPYMLQTGVDLSV